MDIKYIKPAIETIECEFENICVTGSAHGLGAGGFASELDEEDRYAD